MEKRGARMLTRIIEEVGKVQSIHKGRDLAAISIGARMILEGTCLRDSIAINGICLTVTSFSQSSLTADVTHETLNRSPLGSLCTGGSVNLERAMPVNGGFGGHTISGHIDGIGTISVIAKDDNAI